MAAAKQENKPMVFRFTVNGDGFDLDINPDNMPIRDKIDVEEYLEMPWDDAARTGWLSSNKALAILAYIAMRRRRKTVTLDDVLDAKELEVEEVKEKKRPTKGKTPDDSGNQS